MSSRSSTTTIERVEGSNRVRRSQGQKPAPLIEGDPSIPVLSIHTIGDLFVPIEMQLVYADRVEANGKSDLLVQRAIRDVGHCTFSGSEWVQSYTDLFAWVTTGDAPKGEDLRGHRRSATRLRLDAHRRHAGFGLAAALPLRLIDPRRSVAPPSWRGRP
jgi:hypothetical protein